MANPISEALLRFFSPKVEVLNHWYAPVDNFQFVTSEFYQMIEKELQARKVPGLEISRVEFSEGGLLSDKREYLRLKRERLVFDICAAPFGTSYFFSFRFVELPLGIKPLELLIFWVGLVLTFGLLAKLFGTISGILLFLALVVGAIWFLRNVIALGLKDLDATLLKTPVVGPIYEIFFRKETYYRQDTRLMYLTTVNNITKALVDEVTAAKGIKLVKRYERRPIFGELYQEKTSSPASEPSLEKAA
jgi:hypothetical protein